MFSPPASLYRRTIKYLDFSDPRERSTLICIYYWRITNSTLRLPVRSRLESRIFQSTFSIKNLIFEIFIKNFSSSDFFSIILRGKKKNTLKFLLLLFVVILKNERISV